MKFVMGYFTGLAMATLIVMVLNAEGEWQLFGQGVEYGAEE